MCGIIGCVGKINATTTVIDGLAALEYRGYDSCGLCLKKEGTLKVTKTAGRVSALAALSPEPSELCIGHTRWATHGKATARNAHPHLSEDGTFAVVHNGIIENTAEVKKFLGDVTLKSDTDSELLAHLLSKFFDGNVLKAVERTAEFVKGTYTFLAISAYDDNIYAYRKNAGLIVGIASGFNLVASDMPALSALTDTGIIMSDDDLAVISADGVKFFRFGKVVEKKAVEIGRYKSSPLSADTYMQSEIDEIPAAAKATVSSVLSPEGLPSLNLPKDLDNLFLCGCGTAYHASLYAKSIFEKTVKLPTVAEVASEIKNCRMYLGPNTLSIFVSQSGETRDTVSALRYAKSKGAYTVALTNVRGSSLSTEADFALQTDCGSEIAVAATKTLISQMLALYLTAEYIAKIKGLTCDEQFRRAVKKVDRFNVGLRKAVCSDVAEKLAESTYGKKVLFLGSGQDYASALEGALKLKEITYKSAEAYRLGEMKHGPIALVDENTLCIAAVTDASLKYRAEITLAELETRGAETFLLSPFSLGDKTSVMPEAPFELQPVQTVVYLQKYALAVAKKLGLDPDKPRNLAKSVTVL